MTLKMSQLNKKNKQNTNPLSAGPSHMLEICPELLTVGGRRGFFWYSFWPLLSPVASRIRLWGRRLGARPHLFSVPAPNWPEFQP